MLKVPTFPLLNFFISWNVHIQPVTFFLLKRIYHSETDFNIFKCCLMKIEQDEDTKFIFFRTLVSINFRIFFQNFLKLYLNNSLCLTRDFFPFSLSFFVSLNRYFSNPLLLMLFGSAVFMFCWFSSCLPRTKLRKKTVQYCIWKFSAKIQSKQPLQSDFHWWQIEECWSSREVRNDWTSLSRSRSTLYCFTTSLSSLRTCPLYNKTILQTKRYLFGESLTNRQILSLSEYIQEHWVWQWQKIQELQISIWVNCNSNDKWSIWGKLWKSHQYFEKK